MNWLTQNPAYIKTTEYFSRIPNPGQGKLTKKINTIVKVYLRHCAKVGSKKIIIELNLLNQNGNLFDIKLSRELLLAWTFTRTGENTN